ncbi:MAG: hypothetical protein IPH28_11040 [Cytophagaceae bacterium]|nr:hypothetical protein [Cytophagaceae bacterium]
MFEIPEKSERPAVSSLFIIIGLIIVGIAAGNILSMIWILVKFPPQTYSIFDLQESVALSSKTGGSRF